MSKTNISQITKKEAAEILDLLKEEYPEAGCALHYDSPYHLLLAVMLSAQTTDVSVNKITPELFRRFPEPEDLAAASQDEVIDIIRSIGLYKNKSKNIISMSQVLMEKYDGVVPGDFKKLTELPGVGRKTANVVLAEGFGEQRIAVDTHVFRVSNRIGLSNSESVLETEKQLMAVLPEKRWTEAHHLLIFHGRRCCSARKPQCNRCPILEHCRHPEIL